METNAKWYFGVGRWVVLLVTELPLFCSQEEIKVNAKGFTEYDKNHKLLGDSQKLLSEELFALKDSGWRGVQRITFTPKGLRITMFDPHSNPRQDFMLRRNSIEKVLRRNYPQIHIEDKIVVNK